MTKLRQIAKFDVLALSFYVFFGISLVGTYIFPIFYETGTQNNNITTSSLYLTAFVFVLLLCVFLFSWLISRVKLKLRETKSKPFDKFGGLLLLVLFGLLAMFVVSLIYGLIAVLINSVLKSTMEIEQILGVVNIATNIITILLLPIFVNIVCVYALDENKAVRSIAAGFKTLKLNYLSFLIILTIFFGIGYLIQIPFNYIEQSVIAQIGKILIISVLGTFSVPAIFAHYKNK